MSRSTRCSGRPAGSRPYNVAAIYRYHPMFADAGSSSSGIRPFCWERRPPGLEAQDFGRASMEGGDVQPIGNGPS